jgi:MFS family permease
MPGVLAERGRVTVDPTPVPRGLDGTEREPVSFAAPIHKGSSFGALRHRRFAIFWVAASISNGANWMQIVAVPAVIFSITRSATWLGAISFATLVPAVILTPFAGVLADRYSRRGILIITQTAQMVVAFAMWGLWLSGHLRPWPVFALSLLGGVATGVQTAVWQSFVPLLVPREEMLNAVRLNSLQFTLARAIGPGFAGIVLTTWGPGAAIFLNAATYALVIAALVFVRVRESYTSKSGEPVREQLRGGASLVWQTPKLRLAVTIAFLSAIFGQSIQHQAAAVSQKVFGHDPKDSATLLTALGLGALAAAVVLAVSGERVPRRVHVRVALGAYTMGVVLVTLSTTFAVGIAGYAVSGFAHLTMATALNTAIQGTVSDEFRGRVTSAYVLGILAGIPLGSLLLGVVADTVGMRPALVIGAMVFATYATWTSRRLTLLD